MIEDLDRGECEINAGGVQRIRIIESCNVVQLPPVFDGVMQGDIVLKAGVSFKEWKPEIRSISFVEPQKDDGLHGAFYEPKLSFSLDSERELLIKHRYMMRNEKYTILFTDMNGVTKLLHHIENMIDVQSGTPQGKNYYSFVFSKKAKLPAPIFTGNITN